MLSADRPGAPRLQDQSSQAGRQDHPERPAWSWDEIRAALDSWHDVKVLVADYFAGSIGMKELTRILDEAAERDSDRLGTRRVSA